MARWMLLVVGLTAGCGGSAFESGAARGDAGELEAAQEHDGGAANSDAASSETSTDGAASSPHVAFCASYTGIADGGPAVYACGYGWQAYIDAGLTVPDAGYALANMRLNSLGQDYPGPACDSWRSAAFDCLDADAGGDGTCVVELVPGSAVYSAYGRCFRSLSEALAGW